MSQPLGSGFPWSDGLPSPAHVSPHTRTLMKSPCLHLGRFSADDACGRRPEAKSIPELGSRGPGLYPKECGITLTSDTRLSILLWFVHPRLVSLAQALSRLSGTGCLRPTEAQLGQAIFSSPPFQWAQPVPLWLSGLEPLVALHFCLLQVRYPAESAASCLSILHPCAGFCHLPLEEQRWPCLSLLSPSLPFSPAARGFS